MWLIIFPTSSHRCFSRILEVYTLFSSLISGRVWKRFRMLEVGRLRLRGMNGLEELQDESTVLPCMRLAVALRCPADPPQQ